MGWSIVTCGTFATSAQVHGICSVCLMFDACFREESRRFKMKQRMERLRLCGRQSERKGKKQSLTWLREVFDN